MNLQPARGPFFFYIVADLKVRAQTDPFRRRGYRKLPEISHHFGKRVRTTHQAPRGPGSQVKDRPR